MAHINGFNHVVLVTSDMDKTVRFYRDVLGLKVKATQGAGSSTQGVLAQRPGGQDDFKRLYFFELSNGDCLAFVEFPGKDTRPEPSYFSHIWPGDAQTAGPTRKLDHLALNVDSRDDLVAYQERLRAHEVPVSEIQELKGAICVKSIYCYDPNGIALEISTWDLGDPWWNERTEEAFFADLDPVPAFQE